MQSWIRGGWVTILAGIVQPDDGREETFKKFLEMFRQSCGHYGLLADSTAIAFHPPTISYTQVQLNILQCCVSWLIPSRSRWPMDIYGSRRACRWKIKKHSLGHQWGLQVLLAVSENASVEKYLLLKKILAVRVLRRHHLFLMRSDNLWCNNIIIQKLI